MNHYNSTKLEVLFSTDIYFFPVKKYKTQTDRHCNTCTTKELP